MAGTRYNRVLTIRCLTAFVLPMLAASSTVAGEIVIVTHGGAGWRDPNSDAKGDVFRLVQHLEPSVNFRLELSLRSSSHRDYDVVVPLPPL